MSFNFSEDESAEQEKMLRSKANGSSEQSQEEGTDDEAEYIAPAYDEMVPVINIIADKLMEANK